MKAGNYNIYYKTYCKCEVHQNTNSIKETKHHTQLPAGSEGCGVPLGDDFTLASIKQITGCTLQLRPRLTYLEERKRAQLRAYGIPARPGPAQSWAHGSTHTPTAAQAALVGAKAGSTDGS